MVTGVATAFLLGSPLLIGFLTNNQVNFGQTHPSQDTMHVAEVDHIAHAKVHDFSM